LANGPGDDTFVALINATPYVWKRGYQHSYDMKRWSEDWPIEIKPKESVLADIQRWESPDAAGEIAYHIDGTTQPMSFMLKLVSANDQHYPGLFRVKFLENFRTVNQKPGSETFLGWQPSGAVVFVLMGVEGDFMTNNDLGGNWMQEMLPYIGNHTLREVALPRTHHSGVWTSTTNIGLGNPHNSVCQTERLGEQLRDSGIRVIDLRPVLHSSEFWDAHVSAGAGLYHGVLGASVEAMVETINEFQSQYPGELIIIDIRESHSRNMDHGFRGLDAVDRTQLYSQLLSLRNRVSAAVDVDVTGIPLKDLIGGGKSGVIIKIDDKFTDAPLAGEGFVKAANFPLSSRWSDTHDPSRMARDQIGMAEAFRRARDADVLHLEWILTQTIGQAMAVDTPEESILGQSKWAQSFLFKELWDSLSEESYPNWVGVDGVYVDHLLMFSAAINRCLLAEMCWQLTPP
jgi:hypothetical protein